MRCHQGITKSGEGHLLESRVVLPKHSSTGPGRVVQAARLLTLPLLMWPAPAPASPPTVPY